MSYSIQRPPLAKTFDILSKDELLALDQKDHVKIMIKFEDGNVERLWVVLEEKTSTSCWIGSLDNMPISSGLELGDKIEFHPFDVIDYLPNNHDHFKSRLGDEEANYLITGHAEGIAPKSYFFEKKTKDEAVSEFLTAYAQLFLEPKGKKNPITIDQIIRSDGTIDILEPSTSASQIIQ